MARGTGPLSAREILDAASNDAPGLGMATVYRTLKLLTDEGLVQVVEIPGQSPRYELTGRGHHHHLYCRSCSRVFEIDRCPGDFADLCPPGFVVEGHELVLFGLCPKCAG
jgi:Fur family ferric uptake transcriptional regulator